MLKTGPLLILSIGAVKLGYFTQELFLSYGSSFYLGASPVSPNSYASLFDASFGGSLLSLLPLTFLLLIFSVLIIDGGTTTLPGPLSTPRRKVGTGHKAKFNLTTHFTLLNYFNVFYHWIKYFTLV